MTRTDHIIPGGCPRRAEGPHGAFPGTDTWRSEGKVDGVRVHTCSFCGSLRPSDFLDLWEAGATVGPTDKSYKLYLDAANAAVRGAGKLYTGHLTDPADQERFKKLAADAYAEPIPEWNDADGHLALSAARGRADGPKIGYPGVFYSRIYLPETNQ